MSLRSRLSKVKSIFSDTLLSFVSSRTLHSPPDVFHTSVKLLIPWDHLYTNNDGISLSLGFIQLGNNCLLIEVCVCDFFKGVNCIGWNQMSVIVHQFQTNFLEDSLGQQKFLDSGQTFMWIVVSLFNQC